MIQRILVLSLVVGISLTLCASPGLGYRSYSDSNGENNCVTCHGGFRDGNPSLHQMHVGGSQMTSNCDLCHNGGDSFADVRIGASGESPDFACTGCHIPDGLIAKHPSSPCSTCHGSPDGGVENTIPQWYGRPDVALDNPCKIGKGNGGEDWDGDGQGLDNDGDGDYDLDDADCVGVSSPEHSWGAVKSTFGAE